MVRKKFLIIGYLSSFILLMVFLNYYLIAYHDSYVQISDFLEEPALYQGDTISIMGTYVSSFEKGFYISYNQKNIKIHYPAPYTPPRYGQVLIYGTLHKEGYIEALGVHNYDFNFLWYGLSFFTAIGVIILFFKEWKITKRGFTDA